MVAFSNSVEIQASPQRAWTVLSDVERWSEWTPTVRSIQRLDKGPLAPGQKARIHQPKLPPAEWQITQVDEGRGFTWVTRSPGVAVTAGHWVEASEGGSRVTLSVQFGGVLGPLVGWLTRGLNHHYLSLEAAGVKRRSEEA